MVAVAVTFFGTAFFASRKGFVNSCPRLKKSAIGKNRRNFRRSGGIGRHRRLKISRPQAVPVQFWSAVPQSIPSRVSRISPAPLREDAFLFCGLIQRPHAGPEGKQTLRKVFSQSSAPFQFVSPCRFDSPASLRQMLTVRTFACQNHWMTFQVLWPQFGQWYSLLTQAAMSLAKAASATPPVTRAIQMGSARPVAGEEKGYPRPEAATGKGGPDDLQNEMFVHFFPVTAGCTLDMHCQLLHCLWLFRAFAWG